jgi:hypothetical protein
VNQSVNATVVAGDERQHPKFLPVRLLCRDAIVNLARLYHQNNKSITVLQSDKEECLEISTSSSAIP